jgi:cardiolipin synthase (CMP-forming)
MKTAPILTAANQITLARMALAPLLVVLVLAREMKWALGVFVVAGFTDMFDGLVARRAGQRTALGAMLDPLADKVLLTSCFIALTWGPQLAVAIPVWLTVVTLSRDAIIVASVALINLAYGRRLFYPSTLGKVTTLTQIVTVGTVLLLDATGRPLPAVRWLFLASVALTVTSALHYVYLASTGRTGTATS